MKFKSGDSVVCIANETEWKSATNDFNHNLKIALGVVSKAVKNNIYTVKEPMSLHYKGTCYIEVEEIDGVFDSRAFKHVSEILKGEHYLMEIEV